MLHEQRQAFLRRRMQESDRCDLDNSYEEKLNKILSQLQPLAEIERPLTSGEHYFCQSELV